MTEKNGYVRWWQLVTASISILGLVITLLLFMTSQVIGIDERATQRYLDNRRAITELLSTNQLDHTKIMIDLQEIKTTLGIRSAK